ncbi:F-actin-monooxygenase MICAL3 [Cimex lectularius]|uniref:BAH domain-containing protein n=1 Tax=Cimex lectularius TaxID=79782 RepID=A0A8I6SBW3_CIMLE|nr:F-actin-monooxygenase MICAL3 [Cimex lectularius]
MLGSPPKPPRLWPEPPPAHSNGLDRFLYSVNGDRKPRVAHIQQPTIYPHHKVEEQVFTRGYTRSVSQVHQVITEESKISRKDTCPCKPIPGWCGKGMKEGGCSRTTPRSLIKSEPAATPCQVQEVTTSSKTDITGNNSGGIPVGIAIARQRVQQNTPSPLTVVTCQDRTTTQVPSWPLAPSHWQFAPTGNGMDQSMPIQQLVVRDPVSGQLMLLQGPGLEGGMQRAVVWPGNNVAPPMQVMQAPPQPQPVLLSDRLVTLAPQQQISDKRRQIHDPVTGVMFPCELTKSSSPTVGQGGSQGLVLQPTLSPQQFSSVLIQQMPFATSTSHHNNSLLLSTQVAEAHSLINQNLVISNHLENTVINPQIIGMESGGFSTQGGLLQHMHPSLVISHHHTETNFMRQDITPVLPSVESPVIVKQEIKTEQDNNLIDQATSPPNVSEDSKSTYEEEDESLKTIVQDASNQTETPVVSDEEVGPTKVKEENEEISVQDEGRQVESTNEDDSLSEKETVQVKTEDTFLKISSLTEPDLSGLELLSNSIAQHEKYQSSPEQNEVSQESERHYGGGLGLLCEVAANHGFFNGFTEDSPSPGTLNAQVETNTQINLPNLDTPPSLSPKPEPLEPTITPIKLSQKSELTVTKPVKKFLPLKLKKVKMERTSRENTPPSRTPTPPPQLSPLGDIKTTIAIKKITTPEPVSPDTTSKPPILPKKRPGRPKKIIKFVEDDEDIKESEEDKRKIELPPVLEPWSALPKQKVSSIPPTLTPHKKRKSLENSILEEPESSSRFQPPILTPSSPAKPPIKKMKLLKDVVKKLDSPIPPLAVPDDDLDHLPKSRIRPKLKAEAKVKSYNDDDELDEIVPVEIKEIPKTPIQPVWRISEQQGKKQKPTSVEKKKVPEKVKLVPKVEVVEPKQEEKEIELPKPSPYNQTPDCKLAEEHLNQLPCAIMMAKGGLFYTGQITQAKAEGIYEVVLEKERHRKPHIMCSEELINNAILEVRLEGTPLTTGTRICAYWSQQYNCLYPGSVSSSCGKEDKFVNVEFDDGDNGKINRDDIRLLPQDYPTIEYDPNPLSLLGKRKRLNSSTSADSNVKSHEQQADLSSPKGPVEEKADKTQNEIVEDKPVEIKKEKPFEQDDVIKPPKKKKKKPKQEKTSEKVEELSEKSLNPKAENDLDEESVDNNFPSIISSIVEDFFQSEQERKRIKKEKRRRLLLERGGRLHKHKHKDGCRTHHKRKHKHHRKHKRKHSIEKDEKNRNKTTKSDEAKTQPDKKIPKEDTTKNPQPKKLAKKNVKSKSKIAAFLPERHELWAWKGEGVKRGRALGPRGKGKKIFYKSIQRGNDLISVGDCAVFVSTGRPDRPFIGKIESLWATIKNSMAVKVSWFYHPEEAIGAPEHLNYPGGLFESPHNDCNDVQTISHKCEVVPLKDFLEKMKEDPEFLDHVYENQEIYYLAGHYDPHNESITFEPGVQQ